MTPDEAGEQLTALCKEFKLPTLARELVRRLVAVNYAGILPLLLEIFLLEAQDRHERRVERLRRASSLPPGKTLGTFDMGRLSSLPLLVQKIRALLRGEFLDRAHNVLCFGAPGTGKSHVAAAIGHALVERGRSVLFVPAYRLVQELLAAKRDHALPRALRRLDGFELVIVDDIGYLAQSPDEAEVLLTLVSERYERRSLLITSNVVFSEWERIFKNQMATAAAIDRLVHHAVILEFQVPSYRIGGGGGGDDDQTPMLGAGGDRSPTLMPGSAPA